MTKHRQRKIRENEKSNTETGERKTESQWQQKERTQDRGTGNRWTNEEEWSRKPRLMLHSRAHPICCVKLEWANNMDDVLHFIAQRVRKKNWQLFSVLSDNEEQRRRIMSNIFHKDARYRQPNVHSRPPCFSVNSATCLLKYSQTCRVVRGNWLMFSDFSYSAWKHY